MKAGDHLALCGPANPVRMFALTSGTTGETKFIPITSAFLRDYRRGWSVWGINAFDDHPELHNLKILQLASHYDRLRTAAGLPCGNARGNHDITKEPGWPNDGPSRQIGPKRQDVGDMIDTPEPPIQGADLTVPDEGERHAPACAARRRPSQPIGQPPDAQRTSGSIGDRHIETPAAALSLGWHDIQEWRPLLPLENDS